MANTAAAGTTALVNVLSGAKLNTGNLNLATLGGTTTSATLNVNGANSGILQAGGVTNAGSIICSEGTCDFFGNVTNVASQPTTGRIVITANSQATFFDDVVNQGTIQVSAAGLVESTALFLGGLAGNGVNGSGSVFLEGDVRPGANIGTMTFGGDVSIGASAIVKMELAGTTPGTQFDRVAAQQSLALSGTLELSLAAGFTPSAGQSFDLFDWGSRSGTFASIQLPLLPGLAWNTSQLYVSGIVSIAAGLPGDYNGNGVVDAADYVVWRNDPNRTPPQYDLWRAHLGQTSATGSASASSAVPEPTTFLLLLGLFAAWPLLGRFRTFA